MEVVILLDAVSGGGRQPAPESKHHNDQDGARPPPRGMPSCVSPRCDGAPRACCVSLV
ncbi:hypothetical protein BC567DRAFT_227702 [Phyllosticta citribraziliensis]